jgi:peroxiredoxin
VTLDRDGSFRVEDVPPGRYLLKLPFQERTHEDQGGRLAFARAEVVVPVIPGGRSDDPLDIGAITLDVFPLRTLNVGDPAPSAARVAADGRPLDLAAYRGKFVLLAFWNTWRNSSLALLPHLKATYEAFGRDERFALIGLGLDVDPEMPARYAARRGLNWEQRYLGNSDDPNAIAAAFGVRWAPQVILIGPDGKVLAKDLAGEPIKETVAKALDTK